LIGKVKFGSTLSVLDFGRLGSSISMRSFARFGSSLAILDLCHMGSSLAVRWSARCGSDFKPNIQGKSTYRVKVDNSDLHYIEYKSVKKEMSWYTSSGGGSPVAVERMVLTSTGGTMHGLWNMDADGSLGASTSDRSLKTNIRPLYETLREEEEKKISPLSQRAAGIDEPARDAAGSLKDKATWKIESILRKLRPVSFNMKGNTGHTRLGFIADEIFDVLPQVHRISPHTNRRQGIMYQDLLAFLTNMLQELFGELSSATTRLQGVEERIHKRKQWKRRRMRQPSSSQRRDGARAAS